MNSDRQLPLSSAMQSSLHCLRQAFDCAARLQIPAWEFAVETDFLRSAFNLSQTEIRWLIGAGYAEHALETTDSDEPTRQFHSLKSLTLPARTCLILTNAGESLVKQALAELRAADVRPVSSTASPVAVMAADSERPSQVPLWDSDLHELRLGRKIIKRFRCPAHAQELILSVFEEEGWPAKIDDPLPMTKNIDPKRRLHQTIRNLNRAQSPHGIHFSINGNGQSIRWNFKIPPTRKRPRRDAKPTRKRR
jgi:hypothetical protein